MTTNLQFLRNLHTAGIAEADLPKLETGFDGTGYIITNHSEENADQFKGWFLKKDTRKYLIDRAEHYQRSYDYRYTLHTASGIWILASIATGQQAVLGHNLDRPKNAVFAQEIMSFALAVDKGSTSMSLRHCAAREILDWHELYEECDDSMLLYNLTEPSGGQPERISLRSRIADHIGSLMPKPQPAFINPT